MAIEKAKSGPVPEGVVGGGTGMTSFGFKGGIGTSSRQVKVQYTVGVLVMTNTASRNQLRIDGVPVGKEIKGFEIKKHFMDFPCCHQRNLPITYWSQPSQKTSILAAPEREYAISESN